MYYKKPFSYYKLRFDYRFVGDQTPGGEAWNDRNSGIMVHSQSAASNTFEQHFPVSIEVQLLGGLSDDKVRTTANLCSPGTAVERFGAIDYSHCINSTSKTYHGDQWVAGVHIANGTDVPVEPINPIANFYASVARKTLKGLPEGGFESDQKLSREETLKSMTLWNAYAAFEEAEVGSISLGKRADMTITDQNLMTIDEAGILATKPIMTIVGGEVVFSSM